MKIAAFGVLGVLVVGGCATTEAEAPQVAPTPTVAPVAAPAPKPAVMPVAVPTPAPTFDAAWAVESERQDREWAAKDAEEKRKDDAQQKQSREWQNSFRASRLQDEIANLQYRKNHTFNADVKDDIDTEIRGKERELDLIRSETR